ncbi:Hypothetical protein PROPJV5_0515 [Propionibacterium ruminifibrarum]|uniref:Uncharacterized protein n=1 Tax=Propionibacterium ruminifibrarum TaxID=1962131 RepID=A0A375HYA9_9ACTN|nr:Hypothetical protein PROPJV5_0515 [Propionibacterium ruminifibrarum]
MSIFDDSTVIDAMLSIRQHIDLMLVTTATC